jgi:hypothetical protein
MYRHSWDGNDRVELGRIQHDQAEDQQNLKKQGQASCCPCQDNCMLMTTKKTNDGMKQISFQFCVPHKTDSLGKVNQNSNGNQGHLKTQAKSHGFKVSNLFSKMMK